MAVAVQLTHVTKAFDTTLAVNDVSLNIEKGEFFFLLGPSGCGKSTFLRIVAGFYKPDAGELRFDDTVVNDVPPTPTQYRDGIPKLCPLAPHVRRRKH